MLLEDQEHFANTLYSAERHHSFIKKLEQNIGASIDFRIAEMPIFVNNSLRKKLEKYAKEIIIECVDLLNNSKYNNQIPELFKVPHQSSKPLFSVVDFAITQDINGEYIPKVVELQGFPSLFGYQYFYSNTILQEYPFSHNYSTNLSDYTNDQYISLLKDSLISSYSPDETCLLEYKPEQQKTRPDFIALQTLTGIQTTDIEHVKKEGNKLYHKRHGKWVQIKRVFNRAIVDELQEKQAKLNFHWNEELDIEWAGNPNWYFTISKNSMPYLKHQTIPTTVFLSEIENFLDNLEPFVLKPLFAFSGKGVNVHPCKKDIDEIPADLRDHYILQSKINYADCIYTPKGQNKVEIRIMLIWPEHAIEPIPAMSLARTGRGPMMGVRYNNIPWTGSTGCLFRD